MESNKQGLYSTYQNTRVYSKLKTFRIRDLS